MRFSCLIFGLFATLAAAQTPIPPTETAPTGSVTVSGSVTRTSSGTRSGTAIGTASGTGTISASASGNMTVTTSATPTTTSYPSLGNASPCVANCLQVSISQANCSTIIDVNCYCTSERFRTGLVQCVAASCPSDLSSAENYGQQFCNIVSVSLTYPPAPTTTPASSTTPRASQTTTPTTTANAAPRQTGDWTWGLAAAALGVLAI
ncbi:CFEM domain protein [Rhizoctonia solani AG-3 Rhs1AP]|uniref:CFEM domain protein n=2 Tax=Rhizoctonia solani AG-3 TaxID=1086053 RepID=A0A074RWZ6_9AGAM|nr:CFEM domain protein [Rhizoctonia solani AG-3 Rhs1AP]KEP49815.1 CFEM domain protein [Rhizoctonia solani 123E]